MSTVKATYLQNASSATSNLTLGTDGSVLTSNAVVMGSGSFLRNRIINGGMQIWQRSTAPTAGALASYTYNSVDRWAFYSGTTSCTITRDTSVPTTTGSSFQYSLKFQRTAASTGTGPLALLQVIESVNCYDLSGQNIVLSFWAKAGANFSPTSGNISVNFITGTAADQGSSNLSWTGAAYPIASITQAITTTWTKYTFTGTVGSGVLEAAVNILFTPTGTAGSDDSFYITGVQLEVGSVATPFERRQYGQELALCQRYYERVVSNSNNSYCNGGIAYSNNFRGDIRFVVTKRASPTFGSSAAGTFYIQGGGGVATPSAISMLTSNVSGAYISATATGTTGQAFQLIDQTAASYLEFISEL